MNQNNWTPNLTQNAWLLAETTRNSHFNHLVALEQLVSGFKPITLKEMDSVALLNRIDTKFVMPTGQLIRALSNLQQDYHILAVQGQRMNHYRTLYFDTPDYGLYTMHVNGQAERYKVRSREYIDSRLSFLEVKHKTRKARTVKKRIPTDRPIVWMNSEAEDWLENVLPIDSQTLEPKIWNTFTRITLVNKQRLERVTLDVNLAFYTEDKTTRLDGIAIAEVKLDAQDRTSPFLAQMKAQKIQHRSFSKYIIGVSLLNEQVKRNALKPRLLWLSKISQGT